MEKLLLGVYSRAGCSSVVADCSGGGILENTKKKRMIVRDDFQEAAFSFSAIIDSMKEIILSADVCSMFNVP